MTAATTPQSRARIERLVLGCAIGWRRWSTRRKVLEGLTLACFADPRHRAVFRVVSEWLRGQPVGLHAEHVVGELVGRGELARAGGADYVRSLAALAAEPNLLKVWELSAELAADPVSA